MKKQEKSKPKPGSQILRLDFILSSLGRAMGPSQDLLGTQGSRDACPGHREAPTKRMARAKAILVLLFRGAS